MATRKKTPKAKPAKRVDRRKTTSTRITPETRAKLEATAAQSGRSLAQEIEFRLEQSFEGDEAFGGRQLRALFTLFGGAAVLIEQETGKSCFKDWNTWVAALGVWKHLGATFGPLPPKGWRKAFTEASKATSITFSEPPPKDAEIGVQAAYLMEASKAIHALSAFHRYLEDDRVQEAFGEDIAAALLPKKPEKES